MCEARQSGRPNDRPRAFPGRPRHGGTTERKRRTLRRAATVTAVGLALSLPAGTQALAALNPVVLKRLDLDAVTLGKVKAYDRYRTREARQKTKARKALTFARKQIGKPYSWGAAGPARYDCSGLAMAAWRRAGVKIPRVTYSQYSGVRRKVAFKDLRPGDLIFFHGRSHVGIYVGHGRFLHAPNSRSRVRIDRLGAARKRQFAGAVRPGAPAYKKWSPSIRELVEKIDRMSAQEKAHKAPETTADSPLGLPPGIILRTTPAKPAPPANEAAATQSQWPTPPYNDAPATHQAPLVNEPTPADETAPTSEETSAEEAAPTQDSPPIEAGSPANQADDASPAAAPPANDAAQPENAESTEDGAAPNNGAAQPENTAHAHNAAHANSAPHAAATHSHDAAAVADGAVAEAENAHHANEQALAQEAAALDGSGAGTPGRRERRPVPPRGVSRPVHEVTMHEVKAPVGTHEGHGRPANLAAAQPRPAVLAKGERPVAHTAARS
ncbi:C40 family peptidase [Actinomadura litoris]|uniref:C40 family peptidase n=1 Tax=Actinomadura litoris TaxID=2678616 RepID=UPI001C12C731|nr:C40 family peptidase [Actinomadura litoris]